MECNKGFFIAKKKFLKMLVPDKIMGSFHISIRGGGLGEVFLVYILGSAKTL